MCNAIRSNHCGQVWAAQDLAPIPDERGRVEPGGVVPLGACPNPDCQALCYPAYGSVYDLEQRCTTLHDIVSRLLDWEAMMGGWDAPVWEQARHVLPRSGAQGPVAVGEVEALPRK